MSKLNISFVILMIGIWAFAKVHCENQTIAVQKLINIGTIEQVTNVERAQGIDTTTWGPQTRMDACKHMNSKELVIKTVQMWYKHKNNKLSDETPGDTFVYTIEDLGDCSTSTSASRIMVIGFKCHAAEGSYPFIIVNRKIIRGYEYVAYVPKEKDFD